MDMTLLDIPIVRFCLGLVLGLVLGSFTTMLSYRLPRKLSIISPPSQCPQCHACLKICDLVPVFSWLISRGLCRHCGNPIGSRYLLIEIVTTLAVVMAFMTIGIRPALVFVLPAIITAMTCITIYLERRKTV